MKLEMKNVKVYDSMSEETICFEGNLYADGRKVGRVENSGKGSWFQLKLVCCFQRSLKNSLYTSQRCSRL